MNRTDLLIVTLPARRHVPAPPAQAEFLRVVAVQVFPVADLPEEGHLAGAVRALPR